MNEAWTIHSLAMVKHDEIVVRVDEKGAVAEHPALPGAQVYVAVDGNAVPRSDEAATRAKAIFRNRYGAHDTETKIALGVGGRAGFVTGGDVARAIGSLGLVRVALSGRPRVYEQPSSGRQMMLAWEDGEAVPSIALDGIARAAGVDLAELEVALGITTARALDERRTAAIAETKRRIAAERAQTEAEEVAARARAEAQAAAERAAEAQRKVEAAEAAARAAKAPR